MHAVSTFVNVMQTWQLITIGVILVIGLSYLLRHWIKSTPK